MLLELTSGHKGPVTNLGYKVINIKITNPYKGVNLQNHETVKKNLILIRIIKVKYWFPNFI